MKYWPADFIRVMNNYLFNKLDIPNCDFFFWLNVT